LTELRHKKPCRQDSLAVLASGKGFTARADFWINPRMLFRRFRLVLFNGFTLHAFTVSKTPSHVLLEPFAHNFTLMLSCLEIISTIIAENDLFFSSASFDIAS